ncbi:MAG: 50S ribosomal protein L3 [Candidatus Anstonellales archaeon]
MTDIRKPRRGSLAVRPRKRAKRLIYKLKHMKVPDKYTLSGFIGYKVGMISLSFKKTVDKIVQTEVVAGTVIEVPPILVYGIRYYLSDGKVVDEISVDENIKKLLGMKRIPKSVNIDPKTVKYVRLLVLSDPTATGGVEVNHIFRAELDIVMPRDSVEEQIKLAKNYLGKSVRFADVFKVGDMVNVGAVTKGKGWQGEIKRFGVAKQRRKATGKVRHVGTLGPWHPHYVMYYVPRAGQTGFHNRLELNKTIMVISSSDLNIKFDHYGFVKSDYVIVKGSIPGAVKRPVMLGISRRGMSEGAGVKEELKDIKVIL